MPKFEIPRYEMPEITAIDSENTIVGDIKRKIEEQNNLVSHRCQYYWSKISYWQIIMIN